MVNLMVLAPGHVEFIKQNVLISTSTEFSLEELNDFNAWSLKAPVEFISHF
jgi:hypothetical protein